MAAIVLKEQKHFWECKYRNKKGLPMGGPFFKYRMSV
jgi:hypothetical protein